MAAPASVLEVGKQVEIRTSYRLTHATPGHQTYGVWVNGGKAGDLTVRNEESVAFVALLEEVFKPAVASNGGTEKRWQNQQ